MRERERIWNEIYNKYKEQFIGSGRTLPQLKERTQNLEYQFKNLKLRTKTNHLKSDLKVTVNAKNLSVFQVHFKRTLSALRGYST